jgi:D-alanine-D-alanine ligase
MLVGLTYDLRSEYLSQGFSKEDVAELDSEQTIDAIESTIKRLGFSTARIGSARALVARLIAGDRWDVVFNIAEGLKGRNREAQVPAILELYDLPYTFSDPLVCALTLDKAMTKRVVRSAGLATPDFFLVEQLSDLTKVVLTYPLFAKPVAEGTGKGIDKFSKVDSPDQLRKVCKRLLEQFKEPVVVEEYLPGREFTTAVLGTGSGSAVLGTMEFVISKDAPAADYSFTVKELCEKYVTYFPMPAGALRRDVEKLALESYKVLQCRDAARVDIRLDKSGRPMFLEINPLPGMHPTHSDLPMIATQEGMSYEQLIGSIIKGALERGNQQ